MDFPRHWPSFRHRGRGIGTEQTLSLRLTNKRPQTWHCCKGLPA